MTKNSFVAEVTFKQFTKWCFTLWLQKKEDDTLLIKRNVCRWKRGSSLSEIEITTGIA